jgi:hypothetical protein
MRSASAVGDDVVVPGTLSASPTGAPEGQDRPASASLRRGEHRYLFHEYFHGDTGAGLGASHQTGWTGLVAKLIQQQGEFGTITTADRKSSSG